MLPFVGAMCRRVAARQHHANRPATCRIANHASHLFPPDGAVGAWMGLHPLGPRTTHPLAARWNEVRQACLWSNRIG